jgi:hypothetical protein
VLHAAAPRANRADCARVRDCGSVRLTPRRNNFTPSRVSLHASGEIHRWGSIRAPYLGSRSAGLRMTLMFYLTLMGPRNVGRKALQKGASPANSKAQVDPEIRPEGTQVASGRPRPAGHSLEK